jgi:uncharacterized lipoprotein
MQVIPMRQKQLFVLGFLSMLALAGCSSEQMYSTGQAYQRNECLKIPDPKESQECLNKANKRYDDYKRETDGSNK